MEAPWGMQIRVACVFAIFSVLSACGSRQFATVPAATPVVPVGGVINTLKCGLSNALLRDTSNRSGLLSSIAVVKLDVNVVQGRTLDGSISAGIPISPGATFSPRFGASRTSTLTNNSTIDFKIRVSGYNPAACAAVGGEYQDAGFSLWLSQVVEDINNAASGPPLASIGKYTYDSNFIVVRSAKGGAEFSIVPVKVGASFDASRSDIQHIRIEIEAVSVKDGKTVKGGPDFNVGAP